MADKCVKHPDRDSVIKCLKMDFGYCGECLDNCDACTDPCTYCKHRGQCVIWELCRKSDRRYQLENELKGEA